MFNDAVDCVSDGVDNQCFIASDIIALNVHDLTPPVNKNSVGSHHGSRRASIVKVKDKWLVGCHSHCGLAAGGISEDGKCDPINLDRFVFSNYFQRHNASPSLCDW